MPVYLAGREPHARHANDRHRNDDDPPVEAGRQRLKASDVIVIQNAQHKADEEGEQDVSVDEGLEGVRFGLSVRLKVELEADRKGGGHAAKEYLSASAWLDELQHACERELPTHVDWFVPEALRPVVYRACKSTPSQNTRWENDQTAGQTGFDLPSIRKPKLWRTRL